MMRRKWSARFGLFGVGAFLLFAEASELRSSVRAESGVPLPGRGAADLYVEGHHEFRASPSAAVLDLSLDFLPDGVVGSARVGDAGELVAVRGDRSAGGKLRLLALRDDGSCAGEIDVASVSNGFVGTWSSDGGAQQTVRMQVSDVYPELRALPPRFAPSAGVRAAPVLIEGGVAPNDDVFGPFLLDAAEVTVASYAECVAAGRCSAAFATRKVPLGRGSISAVCNWGKRNRQFHPMNCVSASEARAYCAWRGGWLPSEGEWLQASARVLKRSEFGIESMAAKVVGCHSFGLPDDQRRVGTCPVGMFSAGNVRRGLFDMVGNVAEWTEPRPTRAASHSEPSNLSALGGSFATTYPGYIFDRDEEGDGLGAGQRWPGVGFRCAAVPVER